MIAEGSSSFSADSSSSMTVPSSFFSSFSSSVFFASSLEDFLAFFLSEELSLSESSEEVSSFLEVEAAFLLLVEVSELSLEEVFFVSSVSSFLSVFSVLPPVPASVLEEVSDSEDELSVVPSVEDEVLVSSPLSVSSELSEESPLESGESGADSSSGELSFDGLFVSDFVVEYRIPKFRKTNQSMTIDLRPICNKGQRVKKGDILTEGYSTANGELALGKNLLVAYMPWKGYNYEDAIVLNERVVREDLLTSVHVDEYILEVRETKRGMEELTSDIPNVSEEATKDLDENGIVRVGARIEPGDILIGKITPKGESDPSPEEKLLRAIFGDKAGDVKDASLKASPSLRGVVIDKKLYSRVIKTRSEKNADKAILPKLNEEFEEKAAALKEIMLDKLMVLTADKVSQGVKDYLGTEVVPKGAKFNRHDLSSLDYTIIQLSKWTADAHKNEMIRDLIMNYLKKYKELDAELKRKKFALTIGDELPSGIIQMAKVYVAKKRKIGVGDKMAGRHGNKGIVSRIVRQEDMPFLADGTPVDIVLNPLGVPSRMNIGQIFEAVLGRAGKELGVKFATPIFDGATMDDLDKWTDKAGLPRYCKTVVYDGGTGEQFDQPATVGVTYMLKLGHMVEDKMHARSIGPYSLITQQPLGGKAQFGGQRFGEMEVWAIEAFGAAHVLQEILTIKSDDVVGRSKAYEAIVKGEPMPTPGIPESLNVLLHELRGLCLSITLE